MFRENIGIQQLLGDRQNVHKILVQPIVTAVMPRTVCITPGVIGWQVIAIGKQAKLPIVRHEVDGQVHWKNELFIAAAYDKI